MLAVKALGCSFGPADVRIQSRPSSTADGILLDSKSSMCSWKPCIAIELDHVNLRARKKGF